MVSVFFSTLGLRMIIILIDEVFLQLVRPFDGFDVRGFVSAGDDDRDGGKVWFSLEVSIP